MADKKVSQLTALTGAGTASGDLLYIVDVSEPVAADQSKKITLTEFQSAPISAGTANGVLYLNGSKVPTSGSGLTYDGTTLAASNFSTGGSVTLSGGTANGVPYLDGSKVLTTGSALTFDGTRLGIGSAANTEGMLTVGTGTVTDKNGIVLYRGAASSVLATQAAIFNELNGIGSGESITLRSPAGFKFQNNDGSSEWMRLTSTGLGIGTSSPVYKLTTNVTGGSATALFKTDQSTADIYLQASGTSQTYSVGIGASGNALRFMSGSLGTTALLDSSGNLGLGVTPSAWGGSFRALQVTNASALWSATNGDLQLANNAYYDGSNYKFIYGSGSAYAAQYQQKDGKHIWQTIGSGTAGNTFTFSDAMTLDADGRWVVGSSSPSTLRATIEDNGNQLRIRNTTTRYRSDYAVIADGSAEINVFDDSGNVYMPLRFAANTVAFLTGSGSVTERARITSGGTFETSLDASIYGVTVGRGAGAVSTNTAVGASALAANTTGTGVVAIGRLAAYSQTSAAYTTAVGEAAAYSTTTGNYNSAFGNSALYANTTGSSNVALGQESLRSNTTASNNTAVGYQAGYSNTTGAQLTAIGYQAAYASTGGFVVAIGQSAARFTTTGTSLVAVGNSALVNNTTGAQNTAVGEASLASNTTASNNTAVGYQAGYSNTTGFGNLFVGRSAGYASTGSGNCFIGYFAGSSSTGSQNTFIGSGLAGSVYASGEEMTTGSKNTILGNFSGNQGGLDIRTASNYIVLSDGDGNPRAIADSSGNWGLGGSAPLGQRLYVSGGQIWHASNQYNVSPGSGTNYEMVVRTGKGWLFYVNDASDYGANITRYGIGLSNVEGTSGIGVTFPATQSASSNANTLDDYERGSWTPSVGGTATYTLQEGFYTKIGNQVTATGKIQINSIGTGSQTSISGLPFTSASPANGTYGTGSVGYFANLNSAVYYINAYVPNGTAVVAFNNLTSLASTANNAPNTLANSTRIDFCVTYFV